jgi:hypothetical protein
MLLQASNENVLEFLRQYAKEKNVKLFCFVLFYQYRQMQNVIVLV